MIRGRRNPFIAAEGAPWLVSAIVGGFLLAYYVAAWSLVVSVPLVLVLYLVFRDPVRDIPAAPLGVVSPVDGRVERIDLTDRGVFQGEAHRILIAINPLGTYTARSPVEGYIRDLNALSTSAVTEYRTNALWLQTDENVDVVLQFRGHRFGLAPKAFMRYGERLGQGRRCAYLRLTRYAELHLPVKSQLRVREGDIVTAGTDLIARLPQS